MKKYILLFLFMVAAAYCKAQGYDGSVNSLVSIAGKYQQAHQPEKVYLQLDKSNYSINDTLWFKAYLFNASTFGVSAKSNIVYIELSDETNIVQTRRIVVVNKGLGSGCIPLIKRDFPEGGYTIRAYTQWMRNFNESLIFEKQFYVSSINRDKWLINLSNIVKNNAAQLNLKIYQPDKQLVRNQLLQLGIRQGGKVLQWDKPETTSPFGLLSLDISLPDKPEPRYAFLQKAVVNPVGGLFALTSSIDVDKNAPIYKFPIIISRAEKTDVQFMPEGGSLVNGISSVVAFKAIGEDGKAVDVSGTIVKAGNEQVAVFKTAYKGMGRFAFMPQANTIYKAIIDLPDGSKKEYPFPQVKLAGTVLTVTNPEEADSISVKITSSPGRDGKYILLGQSREMICFAAKATLNLANNQSQILKVSKSAFAEGVVKFILLNEQLNTLNERLAYINRSNNLNITVTPTQKTYAPQDSVALQVEVKDNNNKPVHGFFSMAVINDLPLVNQQQPSILTYLLLSSDLKGYIETPEYYQIAGHSTELDNLLLTQGWVSFNWQQLLSPAKPLPFPPETDISISGKVTNVFGKPVKKASINLLSLRPLYSVDTLTNDNGEFVLKNLPHNDSATYISVRNQRGNSATYGIDIKKFEWPQFTPNRLQLPWYVNTDTSKLRIADTLLARKEKLEMPPEGIQGKILKEVEIKEKKIVNGSHNLNGPGEATQILDEHDIVKAGSITLLELLKNEIKGFRVKEKFIGVRRVLSCSVNNVGVVSFIVDGIDIHAVRLDSEYLLNYYTSDDIKGVEVMYAGFVDSYVTKFMIIPPIITPVFIEITTREGTGPFMKKHPADLVYKSIPAVSAKEFYRPRYAVKNPALAVYDQRTTIHWEPNIITDKDGKATVTFYAAGQPATYTITTEGSNMNGDVGSSVQKLLIKANSP